MQTKRTIIAMIVMMALVLVWTPTVRFVGKKMGYDMDAPPPVPAEVAQTTTAPSTGPIGAPTSGESNGIASGTSTIGPATSTAGLRAVSATQQSVAQLGSPATKDPQYPLAVRLTSEGAAIDSVQGGTI